MKNLPSRCIITTHNPYECITCEAKERKIRTKIAKTNQIKITFELVKYKYNKGLQITKHSIIRTNKNCMIKQNIFQIINVKQICEMKISLF
ncbi:hypothetical protein KFK09_011665 [Dendrobium nobile]|uniref:Uncharacterized protein n=1 Tax=Dendrobium nobile TaxID=94219 RepID=A0A8T3BFN6_DENNO|nr:hypothetical protein KFK09_011665 [Dendrobium nobile]